MVVPLVALTFCLSILSGCNNQQVEYIPSISSNTKINVRELKPLEKYNLVHSKLLIWDEETAVNKADLIAKVTLKSKKEISIDTSNIEEIPKEIPELFYTVFDFNIDKLYYSSDKKLKAGSQISAFTEWNSHSWDANIIELNENDECIIFLTEVKPTAEDPAKMYEIAKYVVTGPTSLILKKDTDGFNVNNLFKSVKEIGEDISSSKHNHSESCNHSDKELYDEKVKENIQKNFMKVKDENSLEQKLNVLIKKVKKGEN